MYHKPGDDGRCSLILEIQRLHGNTLTNLFTITIDEYVYCEWRAQPDRREKLEREF